MNDKELLHAFSKALGLCMTFIEEVSEECTDLEAKRLAKDVMHTPDYARVKEFFTVAEAIVQKRKPQ